MRVPDADPDLEFHRQVVLTNEPGRVVATVEDHQHHFEVRAVHDGTSVLRFEVVPHRSPWVTCADAVSELDDEFIGAPLGIRPQTTRVEQHCTHMVDMAQIAIRFAGLDVEHRTYDMHVTGLLGPVTWATLVRDDGLAIDWTLTEGTVTSPGPHRGRSLWDGFSAWVRELDAEEGEAVVLLRRAVWLAPSRMFKLDEYPSMAAVGMPQGVCWSAQPQRIDIAFRRPR